LEVAGSASICFPPVERAAMRARVHFDVRQKMEDPYSTPRTDFRAGTDSILNRARCRLRWSVVTTILFGSAGLAIGLPAVIRAMNLTNMGDLSEVAAASDALETVLPWVLAMLLLAIVGLIFVGRSRSQLKRIKQAEQGASDRPL